MIGFAAQSVFPAVRGALERSPSIEHGEIWRLLTTLFVQDGGVVGFGFNLSFLLAVGVFAEQHFSRARWLTIYFVGALAAELIALSWKPYGGGNSVADLALAGALTVRAVNWKQHLAAIIAAIGLAAGATLLAIRDIHGVGYAAGVAIALLLARKRPRADPAGA